MTEIQAGEVLDRREQATIQGEPVQIPQPEGLTHLQFRRYSGCPICNLHLRSVTQRISEIEAAGVREVVVFHSDADTMRQFQGELPFPVISDPKKKLYAEFGVEKKMGPLAAMNLKLLKAIPRAALRSPSKRKSIGIGEEKFNNPADFLIAADGKVVAAKYGDHINDQWSVDELLERARSA
jgi:peroxiredoxin